MEPQAIRVLVADTYDHFQQQYKPGIAATLTQITVEEAGRYRRTQDIQDSRNQSSGGGDPATEKQKNYLGVLGVEYDEDITKSEASDLIEEHQDNGGGT